MTQNDMLLRHFDAYGSITSLEAFTEYGIMRLASRISELKAAGVSIESETIKGKNRFGETIKYKRYRRI